MTLDGTLATTTVGTVVQNTAGTKSGKLYSWDATGKVLSLITSDDWTTADVVENGVSDLNVSTVTEWYDNQTVYAGLNWSSIGPRP